MENPAVVEVTRIRGRWRVDENAGDHLHCVS
jgi:hypothetical protein